MIICTFVVKLQFSKIVIVEYIHGQTKRTVINLWISSIAQEEARKNVQLFLQCHFGLSASFLDSFFLSVIPSLSFTMTFSLSRSVDENIVIAAHTHTQTHTYTQGK